MVEEVQKLNPPRWDLHQFQHYINNKTTTQRNSTFNWQKRLVSVNLNKSLEKSGRCLFHSSDFNYNCRRNEPGNEDGYARAKEKVECAGKRWSP
ncbi:hypothetical protein T4A_3188 [Trichinella pseudospiralis]|uniref:Uncharacterized protein n=1 Tax=Trichinella pseudospiralis TaxID=6337 RepID=A0A0V1EDH7_TRIPS|nr:hypothetical protein T4A_3188 [Trichinella pseudospiralis]